MIRAHAAGIIKTITGAGGCLVSPALCGQSPTKSIVGGIVGAAASSVMDQLTSWMVDAAKAVDQFVMHVALATTTPQLGAAWFGQLFTYMTELGVLLAAVFAVAGIGAAALLHNGRLLGQTLYGIVRAGWGTTVAVALVIVAVTAASSVTSAIAAHVPASFFTSLSSGWGGSAFGGLAAAALAFIVALFTVLAGVVLWLELIFRMAGLYVGVAVLPLVLAAAIYSPLNGMLAARAPVPCGHARVPGRRRDRAAGRCGDGWRWGGGCGRDRFDGSDDRRRRDDLHPRGDVAVGDPEARRDGRPLQHDERKWHVGGCCRGGRRRSHGRSLGGPRRRDGHGAADRLAHGSRTRRELREPSRRWRGATRRDAQQ